MCHALNERLCLCVGVCVCVCVGVRERERERERERGRYIFGGEFSRDAFCRHPMEGKKDNSRSLLMTATSTDSKLFVQTHFSPLLLPFLEQKHHFLLPCLGRYIDAGSRYIMDD